MDKELQIVDNEKRKRILKLINFYNKSFTEENLENLIQQGSIDYFYISVNRMPENGIEQVDSDMINKLISELRN